MSTLAILRSKIETDYLDRTDLSTQVTAAINEALEYYTHERFWFNEQADDSTGTFITDPNQGSYGQSDGVPTALASTDLVEVTVNSNTYPISKISYDLLKAINGGLTTSGAPDGYAIYQNKVYFTPVPDASYTVTMSYILQPVVVSADADTNNFFKYASNLIVSRACWYLYSFTIKDLEQAAIWERAETKAYLALKKRTLRLIGTNVCKPTDF